MSFLEALLLGIVQGATEFLPVSSSGHLVISQVLLGLTIPGVFFEVAVHVATLLSVLLAYRGRVAGLARGAVRGERSAWRYLGLIALATLPAAALGIFFRDAIEALFESPVAPGVALLVTGAVLWSSRWALSRQEEPSSPVSPTDVSGGGKAPDVKPATEGAGGPPPEPLSVDPGALGAMGAGAALLIGFGQAFALVPGISRSGTTVVVALWLGVEAREAAAFSFLMAIPAIGGAALLQLPELLGEGAGVSGQALLVGSVAAAVVGVVAIRTFVAMLRRRSFHTFAYYCWLVGTGFLAYLWLT